MRLCQHANRTHNQPLEFRPAVGEYIAAAGEILRAQVVHGDEDLDVGVEEPDRLHRALRLFRRLTRQTALRSDHAGVHATVGHFGRVFRLQPQPTPCFRHG